MDPSNIQSVVRYNLYRSPFLVAEPEFSINAFTPMGQFIYPQSTTSARNNQPGKRSERAETICLRQQDNIYISSPSSSQRVLLYPPDPLARQGFGVMVGAASSSPALPWGRRADTLPADHEQASGSQQASAGAAASSPLSNEGPHSIGELACFTALRKGSRVQVRILAGGTGLAVLSSC